MMLLETTFKIFYRIERVKFFPQAEESKIHPHHLRPFNQHEKYSARKIRRTPPTDRMACCPAEKVQRGGMTIAVSRRSRNL
jgi:hypothetical protein